MINIDMDQNPHPDRINCPGHQSPSSCPSNNFPQNQDNDHQHKNSFHNNPSYSSLKHPFQKKFYVQEPKADDLNAENDKNLSKGIKTRIQWE